MIGYFDIPFMQHEHKKSEYFSGKSGKSGKQR